MYSYCILSCHELKNIIWVLEDKIVKKMNQRYFRHGMHIDKLVYPWEKNPFYRNNISYFNLYILKVIYQNFTLKVLPMFFTVNFALDIQF